MAQMKIITLAAGAALMVACASTGTQSAAVYTPLSGQTQLSYTPTAADGSLSNVTFVVDGATTLQGTLANGTVTAPFDSTKVSNGIHTVQVQSGGTTIFEASILVQNGAAPAPTTAP